MKFLHPARDVEGEGPRTRHQSYQRQSRRDLHPGGAPLQLAEGREDPHQQTGPQAEQVRQEIAVRARPHHSQQGEPPDDGSDPLEPRPPEMAAIDGQLGGCEDSDRAKHCRRRPDSRGAPSGTTRR